MNILIIGSEGFIGSYLTEALLNKGHEITGYDVWPASRTENNYTYIQGDIMDEKRLAKVMNGIDLVVNLAAKHHDFGVSREEFFEINEEGTGRVLTAMKNNNVKKIVFYSSVAVYGELEECSSESTAVNPNSDYGRSKLAAERLISQWAAQESDRKALVIRPAVVFGPRNYANMYKLIDTVYKGRYVPVGKGENIKSACYVENLVAATGFLINNMRPGMHIYNYSDYEHLSSREIVRIIYEAMNRKMPKWSVPLTPVIWATSIVDIVAKITKINFLITANRIKKLNKRTWHGSDKVRGEGFTQEITLNEGLTKMVKWYLKEIK